MEILNLTLQNFKGHEEGYFEFSRGTNAICGENGAGKTSIFEAIAWVLFDHCDYQKKELIRSGAGSANATVEFLSGLDGRCYRIKRDTQRGYEVYDPQIKAKLNLKKREDVQKWLCEHLGVPRNTELSRLFAETIGIPQGTFTADFLKRPGDRKKIFDPILKVEDYKQTYDNTRNLETYAKAQVSQFQQKLEMAQVQLADWDALKAERKRLTTEIDADRMAIAQIQAQVNAQQIELASLQATAQEIASLDQQHQALQIELGRQDSQLAQTSESLAQAQASAQICEENQGDFRQYTQIQTTLTRLQERRDRYQNLLGQQSKLLQQLTEAQVKQSALNGQLDGLAQLETHIQRLSPHVAQQAQLEQQRQRLQGQIQSLKVSEGQIQPLSQQIQQLIAQQAKLDAEIEASAGFDAQLAELPALEKAQQQVMKSMSHWEVSQDWLAKLQPIFAQGKADRDRHRSAVQEALKQIESLSSMPLEVIETALKEGAIINTALLKAMHQLLTELDEAASPDRLDQKLRQITLQIQHLHQIRTQLSVLEAKQQQRQEGDRQILQLQTQRKQAQTQIQALPQLLTEQTQVESTLQALDNPQAQISVLKRQLQEKTALEQQQAKLLLHLNALAQQHQQIEQDLAQFQSLDVEFKAAQSARSQCHGGYLSYLQHQNSGAQVAPLTQALKTIESQRSQSQTQLVALEAKRSSLSDSLNLQVFQDLQVQVQAQQIQLGQRQGGLIPKEQRQAQVQALLEERQAIFEQSERDRQQHLKKQAVLDFIQEARRIYNQSGPRISEIYQQEISFEADRLFRELLHRQDVALRWTEDYDIQIQDGGHWRTFKSLSGGEQMCAALAVRLALLKTLADISVAFFDEPTTNMDGVRRSQLAEAISNLRSFDQLFVISHDDTFESITESIIRLDPKPE
jgi:DNA repair protein SbcC/Rad50